MRTKYLDQFSSPTSKLVRFFERSRDRWKSKYVELKRTSKRLENQVRAMEKSRACWRERAEEAERRLSRLEQEMGQSKKK